MVKLLGYEGTSHRPVRAQRGLNKKEKRQVKRLISWGREKKIHTLGVTGSISNTPAFNDLTPVAQGDTDLTRDGDMLTIKSLRWAGQIVNADATNYIRIVLFQWHADDSADPPTSAVLLQSTGTDAAQIAGSFRKDSKDLYTILYDRQFCTDTYNPNKPFVKNIYKGFRQKMRFYGGSNTGTSKIYCMLVSDSSTVSHPAIVSQFTMNFEDA